MISKASFTNAFPPGSLGRFGVVLIVLCVHLIFSPVWLSGIAPRFYDDARYVELALLLLVLAQLPFHAALADAVTFRFLDLPRPVRWLLALALAAGACSTLASPAWKLGGLEIGLAAELFVLFLVVAAIARARGTEVDVALTMAIFCGAALCSVKFWLIYGLYAFEGKYFSWISPFLDFANVRFFSQYQAYCLFLVGLPWATQRAGRLTKALLLLVAANFWALHWMVGTRAVWLGLVVSVAVVAAFKAGHRWRWLRAHAVAAALGGVIYLVFSGVVQHTAEVKSVFGIESIVRRDNRSIDERLALARQAVQAVREHPLFGVGPGQFGLQPYPMNAAHPHNVPLQLLSEYGLPGGIAAIAVLAALALFAVRTLRLPEQTGSEVLAPSLVAALLTGMVDAMLSGNLIMPHSQVLFCVVAGWIVGRLSITKAQPYAEAGLFRSVRLSLVAGGALAAAVTTVLAMEYLPLARNLPIWMFKWNPHFWNYGRFMGW